MSALECPEAEREPVKKKIKPTLIESIETDLHTEKSLLKKDIFNGENHDNDKEQIDEDSRSSTELNQSELEKENIKGEESEKPAPSYSKPVEVLALEKKLHKFLDLVKNAVKKSQFEDVIIKKCFSVQKYFDKCGTNVDEKNFVKLLRDCNMKLENTTGAGATIAFHKIYEHLKLLSEKSQAEVMPEDVHRVHKLEKLLTSLMRKIHKLEHSEINFDDEEDSSYMKIDRYKARVAKVYEKYCELINKNPNSGRLTYEKIVFEKSRYKEINEAISKKYRNSLNFPSYYEMELFLRAVVKDKRLDVSESRVKSESKKCFRALGKILQKRRRAELYDCHLSFIDGTEDPASEDPALEDTLKKNFVKGEEKFNKVLSNFNVMAEKVKQEKEESCSESSSEDEAEKLTQENVEEQNFSEDLSEDGTDSETEKDKKEKCSDDL